MHAFDWCQNQRPCMTLTRGRLRRGAQLTAGYTVNTYSKPPLYYTLGAVAPLLPCLRTAAVLRTAHALGPGGPLPHATPIY